MKNKDLDNFFKSRSDSFNEIPSDDLWKKIQNNLSQEPKFKSNFKKPFLTMALPIIALVTVASLIINSNSNTKKNHKTFLNNDSIKKEKSLPALEPKIPLESRPNILEVKKTIAPKNIIKTKSTITPAIKKNDIQIAETPNIQEKIYSMNEVHVKPEYPGSMNKLYTFISKKFKTPKDCPGGRITLTFVVEKDGSLTDIQTVKDAGFGTGAEAIRVLKESSKWEPGKHDGKTVRIQYTLPITVIPAENPNFSDSQDNSPVYSMAGINVQPEFIGGKDNLYDFINQNFKTPPGCPSGKLFVSFIIERDGSLTNIKVQKWIQSDKKEFDPKISKLLIEEVIRLLKECPKWEPGEQNGEKVRVLNSIPINIK